MKYLDKLIELGCFSRRDVTALTGNEHAAHSLLYDYMNAGYIGVLEKVFIQQSVWRRSNQLQIDS